MTNTLETWTPLLAPLDLCGLMLCNQMGMENRLTHIPLSYLEHCLISSNPPSQNSKA